MSRVASLSGQTDNVPTKIMSFARTTMLLLVAVVVVAVAWLSYDSWLRPFRVVGSWSVVSLALFGLALLARNRWLKFLGISVFGLFLVFSLPLPSAKRTLVVRQSTEGQLDIRVSDRDNPRVKTKRLTPGEVWNFTYFSGDATRDATVPITITITRVSGRQSRRVDLDLPIRTNPTPLVISTAWLEK